MKPTKLLNDDGTASMATNIMLSHHAFHRDLGWLARALASFEPARAGALRDEWKQFHEHLKGHHEVEDTAIFPSTRTEHPELAGTIETLYAQHHQIDPLLARGDRAFAALPSADAIAVLDELTALLDAHLELEEASIIPTLRGAKEFPAPPDDSMAEMYAGGFAWAMHGIAPEVLTRVHAMLPASVIARLPAAIAAFEARTERAFGTLPTTASTTSVPTNR